MTDVPRLRFAPSPTGPLHLGGARTALYNWAAARAMGGKFLLRIEDTDRERSTDESLRIILEGLRWLGIDWDEGPETGGDYGPYFQTERLETYRRYADRLLAEGKAYRCYATPDEVEEGRKRLEAEGKRPMYDRRDRDLSDEQRAAYEAEGRVPSLRFRMPLDQEWTIPDLCKGDITINLAELDDWVMVRPDGMPTYNFACVVDDLEMKISHVVRGDEHTMNGFKQSVLFDAFGAEPPRFAHIPLILNKEGKKLSKRDAVSNMLDYRDQGFLPDAIFNYVSLLGWSYSGDQDVFTRDEMVGKFSIEGINAAGSKFDDEKLRWMNGDYIRRLSPADFAEVARPFCDDLPSEVFEQQPAFARNLLACYQERVELLAELKGTFAWLFADDVPPDADAEKKMSKQQGAAERLRAFADALEGAELPPSWPADRTACDEAFQLPMQDGDEPQQSPCWNPAAIKQRFDALLEELGCKMGQLMLPVRVALTGTTKGPGVFDILFLLGKERSVARLRALAERCS